MRHSEDPPAAPPRIFPLVLLYGLSAIAWFAASHVALPGFPAIGPEDPLGVLVKAILWLGPAGLYARRTFGESPRDAFGLRAPRRAGLGAALAVGASFLAITTLLQGLLSGGFAVPKATAATVALTIAGAVVEEASFRGFLLLHVARGRRLLRANAFVSLLFVLVHLPVFIGALGVRAVFPAAAVFVLGLVLGYATGVTRSIHVAVLIHVVNNLVFQ